MLTVRRPSVLKSKARTLCFAALLFVTTVGDVAHAWLERLQQHRAECFPVTPCVMLLGRDRAIGCGQCSKDTITEPVSELLETQELLNFLEVPETPQRVLLVPEILFFSVPFQAKLPYSSNVAAVVVYDGFASNVDIAETPFVQHSTDLQVPNQGFNLVDFKYNALNQTEAQFQFFPFNIFRVNVTVAKRIREQARKFNVADGETQAHMKPSYVLRSSGRMFACPPDIDENHGDQRGQRDASSNLTKPGNSTACLNDGTCSPVGGQSVWSSLGILQAPSKPDILAVTAPIDSIAYFHDIAQGAASEVSSVAVMMAVAEAVGQYRRSETGKARAMLLQPVYFAFTAQSWGYAGSSRFLEDVKTFQCNKEADVSTLNSGCIDPYMYSLRFKDFANANFTVINIGGLIDPLPPEVVKNASADPSTIPTFYLHGLNQSGESPVRTAFSGSFGNSLRDGRVAVPPDASQSFAQYFPQVESVSLTNYETAFTNKFYHSQYDNVRLIPVRRRKPLYEAAQGIAETVIKLSFGDLSPNVTINHTTIDAFIHCLTANWTKQSCDLALEYHGKALYDQRKLDVKQGNYAGVLPSLEDSSSSYGSSYVKADLIATYLAYHNRYDESGGECSKESCNEFVKTLNKNAANHSSLRVGFCSRGRCVASDTFMHNAYGTALIAKDGKTPFIVNATRAGNITSPQAPQWTESYWDANLGLCGFTEDNQTYGIIILCGGIGIYLFSFLLVYMMMRYAFSEKPSTTSIEMNDETTAV